MTQNLAAMLVVLGATGCLMDKSVGTGTINEDGASIGAVSAWAEPSGPSYGTGADTKDYMGWTIHFTHASPGTACSAAPDLVSLADIQIVTAQVDTDPSNQAGHAQRATLEQGGMPVMADFPVAITSTFALMNAQSMSVTGGIVTISSFGGDTIDGAFQVSGQYTNTTPPTASASGEFSATRCLD